MPESPDRRYAEIQRQLDEARAAGMSYEAWIESHAGDCPPDPNDFPLPTPPWPPNDEASSDPANQ